MIVAIMAATVHWLQCCRLLAIWIYKDISSLPILAMPFIVSDCFSLGALHHGHMARAKSFIKDPCKIKTVQRRKTHSFHLSAWLDLGTWIFFSKKTGFNAFFGFWSQRNMQFGSFHDIIKNPESMCMQHGHFPSYFSCLMSLMSTKKQDSMHF